VNRNRLIAGLAVLAVLILLVIVWLGTLLFGLINKPPQASKRELISELAYCSPDDNRPCIVSFSLDADSRMLVNILTPDSSYPDFYLKISNADTENKYECQPVEDFPTHIHCTGREMYPGEKLHFVLISSDDERVLAEGNFAIIGLLLATPGVEVTETALATETPETAEPTGFPTPILLETPTPGPTPTSPSYPNPSYP
jgi:hypothetical protein